MNCNPHPDAPHGFDRNASHSEDRYVCECESWTPSGKPVIQQLIDARKRARDAERYRWLRKELLWAPDSSGRIVWDIAMPNPIFDSETLAADGDSVMKELDAAIDRAIEAEK